MAKAISSVAVDRFNETSGTYLDGLRRLSDGGADRDGVDEPDGRPPGRRAAPGPPAASGHYTEQAPEAQGGFFTVPRTVEKRGT